MFSLELLYQITTALSTFASFISIIFITYVVVKTKELNPYVIFAMGTVKAITSKKFRNIVLVTLMSTLVLFTAYLAEYFFEITIIYKILEMSAVLLFLVSAGLLLASYFQQEKKTLP